MTHRQTNTLLFFIFAYSICCVVQFASKHVERLIGTCYFHQKQLSGSCHSNQFTKRIIKCMCQNENLFFLLFAQKRLFLFQFSQIVSWFKISSGCLTGKWISLLIRTCSQTGLSTIKPVIFVVISHTSLLLTLTIIYPLCVICVNPLSCKS